MSTKSQGQRAPEPNRGLITRLRDAPLAWFGSAVAVAVIAVLAVTLTGNDSTEGASPQSNGVRLISVQEGATIQADPPGDLVVLDVRTQEEFDDGHLANAVMLDFYRDDFRERLSELDRDVPYLLYCRSGNRSGQAFELMNELGFTDVADIDGGILAWQEAGLPTTP